MEDIQDIEALERQHDAVKEANVRQKVTPTGRIVFDDGLYKPHSVVLQRAKRLLRESASELAIIAHGRYAL